MQYHDAHGNLSGPDGVNLFDVFRCSENMTFKHVWLVTTVISFAVGFPVSLTILWLLIKRVRSGATLTPNDFYIINVSIMDLLFFVFVPPGFINHFFFFYWPIEAVWNMIYAFSVTGRPLLMVCVCLDCYVAVVHPIKYSQTRSRTPRIVSVVVVWLVTLAYGLSYYLNYKNFLTMMTGAIFIISIVVIFICDAYIVVTLLKSESGKRGIHPQKQRAIHTVVISLVVTAMSYIPPPLLIIIGMVVIHDAGTMRCIIGFLITTTFTTGSAIMPVLWLCSFRKFSCFKWS